MLQRNALRLVPRRAAFFRAYSTPTDNPVPANDPTPKPPVSPVSSTNALPTTSVGAFDKTLQESPKKGEERRVMQAPNRATVWSRSQQPREKAMVGPRFEQTIMEDQVGEASKSDQTPLKEAIMWALADIEEFQPRPYAAIELIHKQPVRWTKERVVSCDGGGGPLGHPRIFINVDKPQICWCTYCGVPFVSQHSHLQSHGGL